MGEWKETYLGEYADVLNGFAFKSEDFSSKGVPVIKIKNVASGKIKMDDVQFYPHELTDKLNKFLILKGSILIAMTGSHATQPSSMVGRVSRYDLEYNSLLNQRVGKIYSKDLKKLNETFLYYFLVQNDVTLDLAINAGGSANQANIAPEQIKSIPISLPAIEEQKSIASILSSLDNKIDLLHRQNKTLEALAETLFRQCFVEEAEGLENKTLDELIVFDPKEKVSSNIEYTFFDMKCLSNSSMAIADGIKRTVNSGSSFRNGDTLLAKITPCLENGKTGFAMNLEEDELARGSTEFIVMRAKEGTSPYFVYCLARYSDFRNTAILSMTGTSGRQRVQSAVLKDYEIKYSEDAMENFHNTCQPYFEKIKSNQIQIRTLTCLRDMLLPKLMSGEVRVKDAKKVARICE